MARVVPLETAKDIAAIAAEDPFEESEDEATCVCSPLRVLQDAEEDESTRQYDELPTRIMPAESSPTSGVVSRHAKSQPPPLPTTQTSRTQVEAASQTMASVVVTEASAIGKTPSTMLLAPPDTRGPAAGARPGVATELPRERLSADRALLREINGRTAYTLPVIAVRQAPPTASFLMVVAGFTALGMLWVIAVVAMILSLVVH